MEICSERDLSFGLLLTVCLFILQEHISRRHFSWFLFEQDYNEEDYFQFLEVQIIFLWFWRMHKNIWDTTIKGREVSYDPQIFEFLTC